MAGYNYRTQYFTPKARDKSRTDSLLPTAPANFTPATQIPATPDFSGGNQIEGPQTMVDGLSSLVGTLAKQQSDPNKTAITPQSEDTNQQKGGLYGDWKQPVFGNMPLDKFVQLTGMMANAIAPNEWSGRLGRDMANMAGQASMDRRDYEEREQQRADLNKKYEDAQKEKRLDKALDFASKTNNLPLAKAAYGMQKKQWEEDFGVALPDWNPEQTPDIMGQIKQYREGAKELGLSAEEVKQGMAEILFGAGEITGKELLEASFPKADDGKEISLSPAVDFALSKEVPGYLTDPQVRKSAFERLGTDPDFARRITNAATQFARESAPPLYNAVPTNDGIIPFNVRGGNFPTTGGKGGGVPAPHKPLTAEATKEFGALAALMKNIEDTTQLYDDKYVGPVAGRAYTLAEKLPDQMTNMPEGQVMFNAYVRDMQDALLRARSGAQINEQEYKRLVAFLPNINLAPSKFKARMKRFKDAVRTLQVEKAKTYSGQGYKIDVPTGERNNSQQKQRPVPKF